MPDISYKTDCFGFGIRRLFIIVKSFLLQEYPAALHQHNIHEQASSYEKKNYLTEISFAVSLTGECNRHTLMKYFDWNDKINEMLKKLRGVSFEQVELAMATGDLIDRLSHANPTKYPNQKVFLVRIADYIYSVHMLRMMKKYF